MIATPTILDVPLRIDPEGVIRVGQTRVTLLSIVQRHQAGDSPDDIQRGFPALTLGDVYAVIAYYLAHQDEIDRYVAGVLAEAERWRQAYAASDPQAAAAQARLRNLVEEQRGKDRA